MLKVTPPPLMSVAPEFADVAVDEAARLAPMS
jgi:hypothetical protein